MMTTTVRHLLLWIGVALVSVPIGIIPALVLTPFWSWLEATTGIEIGRSPWPLGLVLLAQRRPRL
jgi:hypothetical protein